MKRTIPKISIIIPVFNVEKTIHKCIDSIANQTLKNIEIIIVDDGSTDDSIKEIRYFCENDKRIKIISHDRNKGLLQARRTGILAAKGEYIQHVDADDWIDPQTCESIYHEMRNNICDLCYIGIRLWQGNKKIKQYSSYFSIYDELIDRKELLNRLLLSKMQHSAVTMIAEQKIARMACNKLCDVKNVTYGEDILYTFTIALIGRKCICIPQRLYNYATKIGCCSKINNNDEMFLKYFQDMTKAIDITENIITNTNDNKLLTYYNNYKSKGIKRNILYRWNNLSPEQANSVLSNIKSTTLTETLTNLLIEAREIDKPARPSSRPNQYKKMSPPLKIFPQKGYSDTLLERIHYWTPPFDNIIPHAKPSSSLRIAAIVDERLFRGFRYEAELFILTPANWRQVIMEEDIDFLLISSFWKTISGHWHLGQNVDENHHNELTNIINKARKNSIPTVFWNTRSHLYHSFFHHFAEKVDVVFCADLDEVRLLDNKGIKAHFLPPAVQPAIHNTARTPPSDQERFSINVLYDGITDIQRLGDQLGILERIKPHGLRIVDSMAQIFTTKIAGTPLLEECLLGSVTYNDWITTVQHSKTAIFTEKTLRTNTQQQWQVLETAACGAAALYFGEVEQSDILRIDAMRIFKEEESLLLTLDDLINDEHLRKKYIDNHRERIYMRHTFNNRLRKICKEININQTDYIFDRSSQQ